MLEKIARRAAEIHAATNHLYGGYLPYEFHLRLTAAYASRFLPLLGALPAARQTAVMAAAYFHDTLEDARLTYNDLTKELEALAAEAPGGFDTALAAEIVYALTNDKGRTREERAGDAYYAGIRATPFAPFVKMCDRLANVRYATLWHPRQRMAEVYEREMPHFLESIGEVPAAMRAEAERLLAERG